MITRFKIFENVQQSKSLLNNLDIDINDSRYLELKKLLGKNLGYLGKFTEWLFKDEIDINFLKTLYIELSKIKLDKDINQFKTSEDLYDYLTTFKINAKTNQVINSLPSRARRLVNQELKDLISLNSKYIDNLKDFYSKKGGRYKDIQTLIKDTKSLINNLSGGWNVDSIKYKDSEVVYKDNHTLILHIDNYKRSCDLGSQHWCISTDKFQWEEYTGDFKKQYFIYDFTKEISDKRSMIGVTINTDGKISAAHYRDDTELKNYNELSIYKQYLTPVSKEYIRSKINVNDIIEVSKYGLIDELKRLLDKGVDPSAYNNTAIRSASENGHLEIVKLLLTDKRVDPSDGSNYAIIYASLHGHLEVVKLLLTDKRVDPSDANNIAIIYASQYGHLEIVKLLLTDKRVDPNYNYNYAIRLASVNGHLEVVKLLLRDKRVYSSLSKEDRVKYSDMIK